MTCPTIKTPLAKKPWKKPRKEEMNEKQKGAYGLQLKKLKQKYWENPRFFREKKAKWRRENLTKARALERRTTLRNRMAVLTQYGGNPPKCACCGEKETQFLSVDHINNDGVKDRKLHGGGTGMYRYLVREKFPRGIQILCYNCNLAKGRYGKCPHQI